MSESQSGQPSEASPTHSDPSSLAGSPEDAPHRMRAQTAPFELSQEPVTPEGATPVNGATPPAPAYEHLGELPASYGTQSVYLVAYDPKQLFAYWDVDWTGGPNTAYALHVCRADGSLEQKVDIVAAEAGKYLPIQIPGGTYFVELGKYGRDGSWNVLATSTNVTMPPGGLAGETEPKFATLPFHLSFQRLVELIQDAMGQGEDLTAALARLQHGDQAGLSTLASTLAHFGSAPMHTLETLLGQKFGVSSGGDSSADTGGGETPRLHRDRHDVLAAAAFSSESLSSGSLSSGRGFGSPSEIAAPGVSLGSESLSSGAFSSGALAAGLGGASETLSSGGFSSGILGGLGGSENLSSGGFSSGILGGLGGSETLAAYAAGLSSESLSSFMSGPSSEAWRMALDSTTSGGGFGGGSDLNASERAVAFLHALESHLGMLGGLFSALSSDLSSGGR